MERELMLLAFSNHEPEELGGDLESLPLDWREHCVAALERVRARVEVPAELAYRDAIVRESLAEHWPVFVEALVAEGSDEALALLDRRRKQTATTPHAALFEEGWRKVAAARAERIDPLPEGEAWLGALDETGGFVGVFAFGRGIRRQVHIVYGSFDGPGVVIDPPTRGTVDYGREFAGQIPDLVAMPFEEALGLLALAAEDGLSAEALVDRATFLRLCRRTSSEVDPFPPGRPFSFDEALSLFRDGPFAHWALPRLLTEAPDEVESRIVPAAQRLGLRLIYASCLARRRGNLELAGRIHATCRAMSENGDATIFRAFLQSATERLSQKKME